VSQAFAVTAPECYFAQPDVSIITRMRTAGAALLLESSPPLLSGGAVGITILRQESLFVLRKS